jgi:RNA polymerase sigma factor (sigma-70 family)
MEASALPHQLALPARSPLLRLQSDEKLVALIRRGHHGAFEALVNRYNSRLLAFCRHMLGSTEDAEDVLQEVFTAAFNAICADSRPINARPWLYRIARNRCLNHLRRPQHAGQDSMDVFERDGGATTADTVHTREEFRQIVSDVQELPESQRTALLLREIDALSYEQIAEAMDTTVPSVKSLLVRARVSLAEAAEARLLTCEEVRFELGQVAEGIARTTPPVRRHLRTCERCKVFRRELRHTSRALAAVYPLGMVAVLKKLIFAKLGAAGGGAAASSAAAGGAAAGGGAAAAGGAGLAGAGAMAGGATAGGMISAGMGAVATKAAAGLAAAALVTAGAVEVKHASHPARTAAAPQVAVQAPPAEPQVVAAEPQQVVQHAERHVAKAKHTVITPKADPNAPANAPAAALTPAVPNQTDQGGSTVALPAPAPTSGTESDPTATGGSPQPTSSEPAPSAPTDPVAQPAPTTTTPPPPPPTSADPSTTPPPTTTDPPPPDGDPSDPPPPAP